MATTPVVRTKKPLPKERRIIDGLVYDTTTASVIYRYVSGEDGGYEFGHYLDYECALFQNVWGVYFSYYIDENWEGQETITVHDRASAIKWMERNCSWLIEDVFGKLHEAGEGPAYTPKTEE